ncbi:MAG TPA: ABC transporter permease [Gaiellaceae bacterium]
MGRYVLARIGSSVLVFFALTLFVFVCFFALPRNTFGRQQRVPEQFRIHGSLASAYTNYLWRFVRHGDLGYSYQDREAVTARLVRATPVTVSLVVGGLVVWFLISVPLGMLSALRPRSLPDRASTVFVLAGLSAHPLWLGLVLSWFFGRYLHVLPASGYCSMNNLSTGCDGLGRWAVHLLLPWFTFGIVNAALFSTMIRALLIEELHAEYVTTALAKGVALRRIVRRHVLRNVTIPLVTMAGITAGTALGVVVFVEAAFDLPGIGGMLRQAIVRRDVPMTAGSVLFLALAVMLLNLVVDALYAFVDPRIRAANY